MATFQQLVQSAPRFEYEVDLTEEDLRWLARAEAAITATKNLIHLVDFRSAKGNINTYSHSRDKLISPLLSSYYILELETPEAVQDHFIPPGDAWNGYAALVKIVQKASNSLLLVDQYMDASILTDLLPHHTASQGAKCLTCKGQYHKSLIAAHGKWRKESIGQEKPTEVRLAPAGSLHDRIIIVDEQDVYTVSQSYKDIAKRSPASVMRADPDMAQAKIAHYSQLWQQADPID